MFEREAIIVSGGSSSEPVGGVDAIKTIGGYKIDVSFLDALYAGNKLTASQRDAILGGSDPSGFGLSQYDLYYLTVGRLGSRTTPTTSSLPAIGAYNPALSYAVGALVTYAAPGVQVGGVYQALQQVPPQGSAPGGASSLPSNVAYWSVVVPPGPVVLFDADVLNPTLALVAAGGAGVSGVQSTSGTALATITIPNGRRYRLLSYDLRPNTAGTSMPTDHLLTFIPSAAEVLNGDGTTTLIITPRWFQQANANNAAIAAVAANAVAARLRVELL
jgi:hypothetical protein